MWVGVVAVSIAIDIATIHCLYHKYQTCMMLYTGILKGKNLHKCIISNCFLLWKLPAIQIDTYIEDCSEVWFLDSGQYGAGSEGAAHHVAGVGSHTAISTNVKGQPVVGSAESVRYILLTNTHKHRSITMWGVGVTCVVNRELWQQVYFLAIWNYFLVKLVVKCVPKCLVTNHLRWIVTP